MYPSICLNRFEIDTKLYVCCLYVSNSKGIISVCMVHLCWTEAKKYSYTINQYKSSNAIDVLFLFSFRECVLLRMPIEKKLVQLKEEGKKKWTEFAMSRARRVCFFSSPQYSLWWVLSMLRSWIEYWTWSNYFYTNSDIVTNFIKRLVSFLIFEIVYKYFTVFAPIEWSRQAGRQQSIRAFCASSLFFVSID